MVRDTRKVSWVKAALKDFKDFPADVQTRALAALTMVADGGKPDVAKPMSGLGSGVWELAMRSRAGAFRVVYLLQTGTDVWVVHAFQKKSKTGIATPKMEIDLIRNRIRRLKEQLP
jgi:phage-related protein